MEIITGVERRRRWRLEDKLRIVAEADTPGAIISYVARRYDVSRALLANCRQQVRRGALAAENHLPVFMQVQMQSEPMPLLPPLGQGAATGAVTGDRRVEIALPDGTCIKVGADVGWQRCAGLSRPCGVDAGSVGRSGVACRSPRRCRAWHERSGVPGSAGVAARPARGRLYVFRGKRGDLVKILWHDGVGIALHAKRLESGRFIWPTPMQGVVSVSAAQLGYMLDGIDWRNPQHT